ncbi:pyridoxal-phosphate dependent enzyme [Streptomyces sp. 8K308]|uniref:1-aminocyclopropane-1-carboxylate deaminase/D-cysteine desulfhydrase n=1 Tax=Streptomyces sp. 8K308 TaxID=2530388 RepID=UPI00104C747F|nr:pyridoxal-phosphate dependent enzyme [Streptomyces sp. 8K308]TDC13613.1 pyridoxal-phosphate dependent enzyme [Streptomyces sp. 8K308]
MSLPPPTLPSPLTRVADERLAGAGVELRLKRDDLIHPTVPGNKWRKLIPNLVAAREAGHTRVLTFGGAYSNHVRALAAAAAGQGLESVGVIRGDELANAPRNWSLARAEAAGMRLVFVDRARYRRLRETLHEPATRRRLADEFGPCAVLPEGGSNVPAARGAAAVAAELVTQLPDLGPRDLVCCAVGTGGTLAGIAAGLPPGARALGVAALRGGAGYLEREIAGLHADGWGRPFANWSLDHTGHGGGYGRVSPELDSFAAEFAERHGVRLELRYVAKALRHLYAAVAAGSVPRATRITLVVTGPPDPVAAPAPAADGS